MVMTYRSKVGVLIPITLIMLVCVSVLFIYMCIAEGRHNAAIVILMILIAVSSLFIFLMLRTKYILDDDHLRVTAWPGTDVSVPYSSITYVKGIRSTKASGPLSHDRIRIDHDGKTMYISPVRKKEFKRALTDRCFGNGDGNADGDVRDPE